MHKRTSRHASGWQKPRLNSFLAYPTRKPGIGMPVAGNFPLYYRALEQPPSTFVKETQMSTPGVPANFIDSGPVLEVPSVIHASQGESPDTFTKKEKAAEQSGSGMQHEPNKIKISGIIVNESATGNTATPSVVKQPEKSPTASPIAKKRKTSFKFE